MLIVGLADNITDALSVHVYQESEGRPEPQAFRRTIANFLARLAVQVDLPRPQGDLVASTGGASSGPISFMGVFDAAVDAVRQGGRRRGANMGVLDVHHPDIEAFIAAKQDGRFRNFNLSVAVDDGFMQAAAAGAPIALVNPRTGQTAGTRQADRLLDAIARSAWAIGDPGLLFLDRINRDNPTPALGRITATNPCGEVPLLPYEACVLGSINLSALSASGTFDWNRLDELTDLGVRFLDDCIDASTFPLPPIANAVRRTRRIGLGVMGFADALVDLGMAYDEDAAVAFADRVMARVSARARAASEALATTRGAYPAFPESRNAKAGAAPLRNATRTAIAPTGTLSLIAGCSSGIEPLFAVAYERRVLDDRRIIVVNPRFEARAVARADQVLTPGTAAGPSRCPDCASALEFSEARRSAGRAASRARRDARLRGRVHPKRRPGRRMHGALDHPRAHRRIVLADGQQRVVESREAAAGPIHLLARERGVRHVDAMIGDLVPQTSQHVERRGGFRRTDGRKPCVLLDDVPKERVREPIPLDALGFQELVESPPVPIQELREELFVKVRIHILFLGSHCGHVVQESVVSKICGMRPWAALGGEPERRCAPD